MAHLDTVPLAVGAKPKVVGDRVIPAEEGTALGADDLAGAAVVLNAALTILRQKLPHPPLTFLWTVQEEIGLQGARNVVLSKLGKPELAFNFDGGPAYKITIGANGAYRMEIKVQGIASHAGVRPELGVSAVAIASLAIARLHEEGWHGRIEKGRKRGTANIGPIQGGQATNVVADQATVLAECRSHDPKFRLKILETYQRMFAAAAREVRNKERQTGAVDFAYRFDYESFQLSEKEPSAQAAAAAVTKAGMTPVFAVTDGGLDANWMVVHGIPTVTLGCGQMNPHTTSEALDLPSFHHACRVALSLATASDA
jgi:tripeptide aminopeptidase